MLAIFAFTICVASRQEYSSGGVTVAAALKWWLLSRTPIYKLYPVGQMKPFG